MKAASPFLTALLVAGGAMANPIGPTVVSGSANFQHNGNTLRIQNSANAIIQWQAFSIGSGEVTNFVQPSSGSVVLNRVTGGNASQIMGSLQSNGSVYLANSSGVVFGAGAQVNAVNFVATTREISDASFLAGNPLSGSTSGATLQVTGDFSLSSGFLNLQPHSITGTLNATGPLSLSVDGTINVDFGGVTTAGSVTSTGGLVLLGSTSGSTFIFSNSSGSVFASPGGVVLAGATGSGGWVSAAPAGSIAPAVAASSAVQPIVARGAAAHMAAAPQVSISVSLQKREPLY